MIEPSTGEFNFPYLPVVKKSTCDTGELAIRVVNDFRVLNRYCNKVRFPLPRIDHIFAQLKGAKYFCCLDLRSAFQQVELDEDSRDYTTFRILRDVGGINVWHMDWLVVLQQCSD